MEPIAESLEALSRLSAAAEVDLVSELKEAGRRVVEAVPDCIGLSIAWFDEGLTFSLLTTMDALKIIDAAQYLEGGPCEVAALDHEDVLIGDVLDERRWQLFGAAANANGVRSSLSLPLRQGETVYGSVNFYGSTTDTFAGSHGQLARMFGAAVEEAVLNADLSMASVRRARRAVDTLDARDKVYTAVGAYAAREGIPVEEAHDRLRAAAERAGVPIEDVASLVLDRSHEGDV
jgi:GAF domain-containing protein